VRLESDIDDFVLSISPTEHKGKITYSALLGRHGGGDYAFYTTRHFKNPRDAARNQMRLFRAYVYKRDAQLAALELAIKRR
jgi:hypothetical protein